LRSLWDLWRLKGKEEIEGGLAQTGSFQKFQPIPSSEEKGQKLKANKTSEPSLQHQHKINPSNISIRFYLNPFEKLFS